MAPIMTLIGGCAILLFLPGIFCMRLLRARGWAPRYLSPLEWFFLCVLMSVLSTSWIALILAELGLFSLGTVLSILLLLSVVMLVCARGEPWRFPRPRARGTLLLFLFVLLGVFFYSPPYEYVLGNWDPGTYVNAAAHLSEEGSITIDDRVLRELPAPDRELFYYTHLIPQRYEGGMVIVDAERGIVSPHFYHLYTAWLALLHALAGVGPALRANALFALLAVAALYLAAAELAGRRTAMLTALLVLISAAEIWNARFPTSEIITQFLLWTGLFCLFRYQREGRGLWAVMAGLCFAEAMLARVTVIVFLPALLLILFWRNWGRLRRRDLLFCLPLAAGLVHLLVQDLTVCRSYVERQFEVLRAQGVSLPLVASYACWFILALAFAFTSLGSAKARVRRLFAAAGFRCALGALMAVLFLLAYYIWPRYSGSADSRNLDELAWFVYPLSAGRLYFPLGLYLALAGLLLFIRDGFDERRGSFFLVFLVVTVPFLCRKMIFPSYLWAVRRYVPFVLPALIFFMAFCLARLARRGGAGRLAAALLAVALVVCMQVTYVSRVLPTDFSGTVAFLDRLSSRLEKEGIYVCEGSGPAAPLDFLYGLDVLQLSAQTPEKCRDVERVMHRWLRQGRSVHYISRGGWPLSRSLNFVPLAEIPLETDYLEHSVGRFPRRRNPVQIVARVFRVEPVGQSPEAGAARRVVDIGEDCFGLVGGFHGLNRRWEREDGKSVQRWGRWTSDRAELLIPAFGSRRDLHLTLRASAGSKRPGAPVPVELSVDGNKAATVNIGGVMEEHGIHIPASMLPRGKERVVLTIRSPVWDPAGAGLEGYPSDLGIYLDRVLVEPLPRK